MRNQMPYVLDTSALVGAWRRKYPIEIFPSLWENLEALGRAGELFVPEEVFGELDRQDDELKDWVKKRQSYLVSRTSRAVLLGARAVLADHPKLSMVGTGRGRADPFVIAEAQARRCPVVTEEQGGPRASLGSPTSALSSASNPAECSTSSARRAGPSANTPEDRSQSGRGPFFHREADCPRG